jgi:hypothetical protein
MRAVEYLCRPCALAAQRYLLMQHELDLSQGHRTVNASLRTEPITD